MGLQRLNLSGSVCFVGRRHLRHLAPRKATMVTEQFSRQLVCSLVARLLVFVAGLLHNRTVWGCIFIVTQLLTSTWTVARIFASIQLLSAIKRVGMKPFSISDPISVLLTCVVYLSPFSNYLREFHPAASEAPLAEIILLSKETLTSY